MNRDYIIVPDGMEILHVDTRSRFSFTLHYVKKPRIKIDREDFTSADYEEKGVKAQGVRLASKETAKIEIKIEKPDINPEQPELDLI